LIGALCFLALRWVGSMLTGFIKETVNTTFGDIGSLNEFGGSEGFASLGELGDINSLLGQYK
jgi:hypothetical protein